MINEMPVSLIWEAVFHPPEGMEGWQAYRIEYGGHAERCVMEGSIWLPRDVDPMLIQKIITGKNILERERQRVALHFEKNDYGVFDGDAAARIIRENIHDEKI